MQAAIPVHIPFSVAGLLGSALAIFLAFRNNNAYNRWWEARTTWGNIINQSRILARQLIANTEFAVQTNKASAEIIQQYQTELIFRQIAFAHTLRLQLRKQTDWQVLKPFLAEPEWNSLQTKQNPANWLLLTQARRIKDGIRLEYLGGFDNISLEPGLASLNQFQGACERIKTTPLLRQYHFFTKLFLFAFMIVLPAALIADFQKAGMAVWMIPTSVLISFVFSVMGKVGEVNEDPFENQITDVPLTAHCNTIERDLLEMLGKQAIPPKMEPENGFLF